MLVTSIFSFATIVFFLRSFDFVEKGLPDKIAFITILKIFLEKEKPVFPPFTKIFLFIPLQKQKPSIYNNLPDSKILDLLIQIATEEDKFNVC